MAFEALPRMLQHGPREVVQDDVRVGERLQHRLADGPIARADVEHADRRIGLVRQQRGHPQQVLPPLVVAGDVPPYPVVDVLLGLPVVLMMLFRAGRHRLLLV